jgi:hypothetical protein
VSKPELGKVAVGDRLLVIPARYGRTQPEPRLVAVTKAGRVWIDLEAVGDDSWRSQTWRLRLDTQDAGSGYSNRDRFVTPEQYAWEERRSSVSTYLREQGITVESSSPWRLEEDGLLILANLLRRHDGLDPL